MNFGIPFKRPWGIPFGVPFLGSGTGGPLFPSSGNVGYYNPWDISKLGFSSANNTNLVSDQKSINDLTQGTASANPLFIENDTVTQYTANNQPKLDYDKIVTQDDSVRQPKLVDTGGELAVEFEDGQCLSGIPVTTDFNILIKGVYWSNDGGGILSSSSNGNSRLTRSGGAFNLVSDSGNAFNLGSYTFVDGADLKLVKNNNNIELFENGVKQNTIDVTGESFTLDRISRDSFNFQGHINSFKQWNSAVSTGTPDFELLPDPSTMRKDDGTQPIAGDQVQGWHATGAELAVEFDDKSFIGGITSTTQDDDFTVEYTLQVKDNTQQRLAGFSSKVYLEKRSNNFIYLGYSDFSVTLLGEVLSTGVSDRIKLKKDGVFVTAYLNDNELNTIDTTGKFFNLGEIGFNAISIDAPVYNVKKWNSADSSGTPDYELLPTVASCNTAIGGNVERWNATSHRGFKNRFAFGADDNLNGLAPQSGDFSYMIKLSFNILSSTEYILSDSAGDSALVLLSDNYLYLRDTGGANDISLDNHSVVAGEHVYVITREGNTIKYYVDSILKQTVDVTGRTYTFNRFGSNADSMQGSIDDWGVWNRALTQEEVDYFSYLRNENTNAILQPPITPAP